MVQRAKSQIDAIQAPAGAIVYGSDQVASVFGTYFEDVYDSKVSPTDMNLANFLDQCPLPALSAGGRMKLNAPITLEELTETVASMANSESPGTDGLPAEIYKWYGDSLLPHLLDTFNAAVQSGNLPQSNEAVIVVIPNPGKNPL